VTIVEFNIEINTNTDGEGPFSSLCFLYIFPDIFHILLAEFYHWYWKLLSPVSTRHPYIIRAASRQTIIEDNNQPKYQELRQASKLVLKIKQPSDQKQTSQEEEVSGSAGDWLGSLGQVHRGVEAWNALW
jgi:hypothetical protein